MSFSITERLPAYTASMPPPNYNTEEAIAAVKALTPDQRASLAKGIAIAASSKEGAQEFKAASRSAATAADAIESLFVSLTAKIASLEGAGAQELSTNFAKIKDDFRGAVRNSHEVAVKTATYATSFDELVLKFTADQSINIQDRLKRINTYIDDSVEIKKSAQGLELEFSRFTRTYEAFVSTFSSWAEDQEAASEERIKEIYEELERLDAKIGAMDAAMAAIGALVGLSVGVAGMVYSAFPLAAPAIAFWGSLVAGIESTAIIALAAARKLTMDERRANEKKIAALEDAISKIQRTRTKLEQEGQSSLLTFTTHVAAMEGIWTKVVDDAQKIKIWLQDGADKASQPEYMKISLMEGVKIYRAMGDYLNDYADGVTGLTR